MWATFGNMRRFPVKPIFSAVIEPEYMGRGGWGHQNAKKVQKTDKTCHSISITRCFIHIFGCFIYKNEPTHHDKMMAVAGLVECERLLLGISTTIPAQVARSSGAAASDEIIDHSGTHYDMIILDELTIALRYNLIDIHDVVRIIQQRTPKIEVVITGRDAPHELIQIGDVVTEMNCIKHYYRDQGVQARDGIER